MTNVKMTNMRMTNVKMTIIVLVATFVVIFSGCVGEKERIAPTPTPTPSPGEEGTPIPYETPRTEEPQRIFDGAKYVTTIAKQDLETKLKVNEDQVKIDAIIPVEWGDKSLGYPEEGKVYEPETIPGYVILLLANDKLYEYHSDRTNIIVPPKGPIEDMEEMPRIVTNATDGIFKLIDMARQDLSEKLGVDKEDIQLVKVVPAVWSDTSVGYPEEGKAYEQVTTPGFRIVLAVENSIYEYHTDKERIVPPPELEGEK